MLRARADEAVAVGDGELVHRAAPLLGRAAPIGRDVAQRQPDNPTGNKLREATGRSR